MLALIAGRGSLPVAIARAQTQPALICALEDNGPDRLEVDLWFRLETLGSLIAELKQRGATQVCLAGAIRRPQIDPAAIDAATLPLVPVVRTARSRRGPASTEHRLSRIVEESLAGSARARGPGPLRLPCGETCPGRATARSSVQ